MSITTSSSTLSRTQSWDRDPSRLWDRGTQWDKLVEDNLAEVIGPTRETLTNMLAAGNYETCRTMIDQLATKHREGPLAKCISSLYPLVQTLKGLERAITTLTQGMPSAWGLNPAALIWGFLQLPIQVCSTLPVVLLFQYLGILPKVLCAKISFFFF